MRKKTTAFLPAAALLGAVLLGACSQAHSPGIDAEPGQAGRTTLSYERADVTAVREHVVQDFDMAGLLPELPASPGVSQPELPPLPFPGAGDQLIKGISETEVITTFGNDSFAAGPGTTNQGQAKVMVSPADGFAWCVYRLPSISAADQQIVQVSARVTGGQFVEGRGYWLAVADYELNRWDYLNRTQAETYRHSIGLTEPLISPAGNMYVAVVLEAGQQMNLEFVRQTREDVEKPWFVVDPNISGDHGSWPAAAISLSGVPMVAYVNNENGLAMFMQPDPLTDFNQSSDWNRPPVQLFPMQNADASYLDLVIDPSTGLPRASLLLDKVHEPTGRNSTIGLSAARVNSQNQLVWLPLELAGVDGARFSCIARDPGTGLYAIATAAENANTPSLGMWDIERREFDVQQLLDIMPVDIEVRRDFGQDLQYPHLRYSSSSNEAFAANGGRVIYEQPLDEYLSAYEETGTEPWGSLSFVPSTVQGNLLFRNSYARNSASGGMLFSARFDDSLIGVVEEEVDTVSGSGSWIGGVSQLEHQVDGTPCLAYTYSEGGAVGIRFAIFRQGTWQTEQVSTEPIAAVSDRQQIVLDLAVEPPNMFVAPTGRLIVVYSQFDGSSYELRIAVRQPGV